MGKEGKRDAVMARRDLALLQVGEHSEPQRYEAARSKRICGRLFPECRGIFSTNPMTMLDVPFVKPFC
jgi:hypothetical protein